ncbi:hypothetical protein [Nocardia lasii]|uniref:Uncharacterized protein n=1 Tax=Nocardia lasii TaxID=1616107 RepID=A0ABW1JVS8_9NOCA
MTRDLPIDDDAARTEGADTAYRVANGVARVARAGAYVTGGALVAANGTAREPGTSHADSRYAGWSQQTGSADPSPDAPSPIVTFPDLPVEPEFDARPYDPFPGVSAEATLVAEADESEWRPETSGSDRDFRVPATDESSSAIGIPGYRYTDPGYGESLPLPGTGPDAGLELPDSDGTAPGFELPGFGQPGLGLPGFDGLPGNGFGIPGYDSVGLPGAGPAGPGSPFDGIGDLTGFFDGVGAMMTTNWQVDAHVGLDGVWFTSQMKVDLQVGQVGDQLDNYSQWLGSGLKVPGEPGGTLPTGVGGPSTGSAGPDGLPGLPGFPGSSSAAPGDPSNTPGLPGASNTAGLPGASAGAPGTSAGAPGPSGLPSSSGAPGLPAPTIAPAPALAAPAPAPAPATPFAQTPIAPAPAPIAPAVVAPAAMNPVVATPMQTTIQPDAASTPIANVLVPAAVSPLTAPAADVPSLFAPSTPTKPVELPDLSGTTGTPTTAPVTVPTPSPTIDLDTPTTVKLPEAPTATPTTPDLTQAPITVTPSVPVIPTVPETSTPGTTGGVTTAPSTGASTPSVVTPTPSAANPTPTVDVPTQTAPQPTATVPTQQPTVPATSQPTVDINPPTMLTPAPTVAPTVVPVKPPLVETKPIAAEFDHHGGGYHGVSAGLFDAGLGGDVMVAAFPVEHHGYEFVV